MQLSQTLDAQSLFVLRAKKQEIGDHFKSLTPAERANGFDRYLVANNVPAAAKRIAARYRSYFQYGSTQNKQTVRLGLQIGRFLCSHHAIFMPEAVAVGMTRALKARGVRADNDRLLVYVRRDFESLGIVV